jgi:hypothetical protein
MKSHSEFEKDPHFQEAREHMKAARQALHKSFEDLFPPGFIEERRKARREILKAMRSMLDAAISHTEDPTKK